MIGRSFRVATVWGIPIKVDISWVLIVMLLTYSFFLKYSRDFPNLDGFYRFSMGLAVSLLLFASVLAHELSHAMVAIRQGISIRGITLFIFGGAAEMSDEPPDAASELKVALAGPGMSLALAVGFGAVGAVGLGWIHASVMNIVWELARLNAILVAFNIIPGFPLDGGRVLRATLWGIWRDLHSATQTASALGACFGFLISLLGLIFVLPPFGNFIGGIWFIFIGLFLRYAARKSFQQLQVRELLKNIKARDLMNRNVVSVSPDTAVEEIVQRIVLGAGVAEVPVVSDTGRLVGIVGLGEIRAVDRSMWDKVTAGEVMRDDAVRHGVSAMDEAARVLSLSRDEDDLIPVLDGETLVGIITQRDMMRRLRLRMELS